MMLGITLSIHNKEMHNVCLEIKTLGIDIYTYNVAIKHQETLHIIFITSEMLDIRPRKVV